MKLLTFLFVSIVSAFALAKGQVLQIKGDNFLADWKEINVRKGDTLTIFDSDGKEIGKADVTAIRKNGIVGKRTFGELKIGSAIRRNPRPSEPFQRNWDWGVGLVQTASTFESKLPSGNSIDLSGMGTGLQGIIDWRVPPKYRARGIVMYNPMQGQGQTNSPICQGSRSCEVKVDYLSTRLQGHYIFLMEKNYGYAGAGLGLHMPLAKSSNFLNTDKMGLTQTYEFTGGFEFQFKNRQKFGIGLDYLIYPSSDSVKAQQFVFSLNYLKGF